MVQNYYNVLGINKNASESEIKRAYKQLAKVYHPDYNQNPDAQEKFIEIKKACEELLNPKIENNFFNVFGIEEWEDIVKEEDFDISQYKNSDLAKAKNEESRLYYILEKDAKKRKIGRFDDRVFELDSYRLWKEARDNYNKIRKEAYREYVWARNKIKTLNKLYEKLTIYNHYSEVNTFKIITHLQRVLNNEVDAKERIQKTKLITMYKSHNEAILNGYENRDNYYIQKLEYDIMNQYHPKFIDKFPVRIRIFIRNKMRNLIAQLNENKEVK